MKVEMCSIWKIAIAVSVSIYSVSSVEVVVGRRNRRVARRGGTPQEPSNRGSTIHIVEKNSRSLGIGLDKLKYGAGKGQHHSNDGRGKGKGSNYPASVRGKGKGEIPTSNGKGSGKGYGESYTTDPNNVFSSPAKSPSRTPTVSEKSRKPKNPKKEHVNSKRGKESKLAKSDKRLPTSKPIFKPTRLPTRDKPTPAPSTASTKHSDELPSSISTEQPSSIYNDDDDTMRSLTPYTILYTLTDDERPPFRSELLEVVELTRIYLDRYFVSHYESSELTNLSKLMTLFTNTAFEFGEAIPIDYESNALLKSSSVLFPDKEDLDNILISAFEGDKLDGYTGLLQSLPPSNMFSSTQYVRLVKMVNGSPSNTSENNSGKVKAKNLALTAIVVGGTAGLILIFVSTIFFRRHRRYEADRSVSGNKSFATTAGETFTTHGSRQDDRMLRPICDELYRDDIADHHR